VKGWRSTTARTQCLGGGYHCPNHKIQGQGASDEKAGFLQSPEHRVTAAYAAALSFFTLRASRYLRIFDLATPLCFAQTMPKTGAALFLQPGTGQN
jgi:hypothetical protein